MDGRALDLQAIIGQMMEGYRQVRRKMRQVYLEFDGGTLLILVQDEATLVLLLTGRADTDLVASAAGVLLNDHAIVLAQLSGDASVGPAKTADGIEELVVTSPRRIQEMTDKAEPVVNNWGQIRKQLEGILGKVMGRAQLSMMIDRTLVKRGTPDPYGLSGADVRKLATALVDQVPNSTKRQALMSELETVLAEHQL